LKNTDLWILKLFQAAKKAALNAALKRQNILDFRNGF